MIGDRKEGRKERTKEGRKEFPFRKVKYFNKKTHNAN